MSNNKQQTAVDIIYQGISDKIVMQDSNKALICIHISHDDFLKLHRQAKAIHKEEMMDFAFQVGRGQDYDDEEVRELAEIIYNETFNTHENNNRI